MRGRHSSALGAFWLLAAVAPVAAAESAPLESTKQELRQLESAQKNKTGAVTSDSVKLSAPALDVRGDEDKVLKQWTAGQKAEERKREQQKRKDDNWLVNGVDHLGKEGAPGATKTGQPAEPADNNAMVAARDASDPQYLLKLFDDQKKQSDPKDAAAKSRPTPAPDPFAPFLQGWLGTSPVRDQVMDQFKKGSEAGSLPVASAGSSSDFRPPAVVASSNSSAGLQEPAGQAKPNPYLVELNAPMPTRDASAGAFPMASVDSLSASGPAPVSAPLTTPLLDPLPDNRTPAKGPPPGLTDDKKYFPQQKKF